MFKKHGEFCKHQPSNSVQKFSSGMFVGFDEYRLSAVSKFVSFFLIIRQASSAPLVSSCWTN